MPEEQQVSDGKTKKNLSENSDSRSNNAELVNDFEDVLKYVDGWGRYQIILLVLFFYMSFLFSYMQYPPILYLYVPDHWCALDPRLEEGAAGAGPPLVGLTGSDGNNQAGGGADESLQLLDRFLPRDENGKRSQCFMYDVDQLSSEQVNLLIN